MPEFPTDGIHDAQGFAATEAESASVHTHIPAAEADAEEHTDVGLSFDDEAAPATEPGSHAAAADLAEEAAGEHAKEVTVPIIEGKPAPMVAAGERLPVREYLDTTVVPVLREGLRKLCKER